MNEFRRDLALDQESYHFSFNIFILFEITIAQIGFKLNIFKLVILKNEVLEIRLLISFWDKLSSTDE